MACCCQGERGPLEPAVSRHGSEADRDPRRLPPRQFVLPAGCGRCRRRLRGHRLEFLWHGPLLLGAALLFQGGLGFARGHHGPGGGAAPAAPVRPPPTLTTLPSSACWVPSSSDSFVPTPGTTRSLFGRGRPLPRRTASTRCTRTGSCCWVSSSPCTSSAGRSGSGRRTSSCRARGTREPHGSATCTRARN